MSIRRKRFNFLPENFVEGVDKCRREGYYKCNITKMAEMRRVGFRIDPSREPGWWKRAGNRERKMVSEPRGRSARVLSRRRERPLQRPAVALQNAAAARLFPQGCSKPRWYHGSFTLSSLWVFAQRTEAFFAASGLHRAQNCAARCSQTYTFYSKQQ